MSVDANRRRLIAAALAAPCCAVCARAAARVLEYDLDASEIASGTYLVHGKAEHFDPSNGGHIVNTAFIEVPDGVVVIDTGPSRRFGEALRALIEARLPGRPILRVYNTHHHPDHVFGNQAFEVGVLAAPQAVTANLRAEGDAFADNLYRLLGDWMRGTDVVLPQVVVTEGNDSVGGRRFTHRVLRGHTSADLVVRDDETGVLFAGDVAFLSRAPTTPHADLARWFEALEQLGAMDRERIVPGHGPIDSGGASVEQTADYLHWLETTLIGAVDRGLTMTEAMAQPIPPRLQSLAVVRDEFRRSVVHLYADLQDRHMPRVSVERE